MKESKEDRFKELYWKYNKLVQCIASYRLNDFFYAQDICQDTFLKLYHKMDMDKPDEEIKAWLIVVADNTAKDYLKKGGKGQKLLDNGLKDPYIMNEQEDRKDYIEELLRKELRSVILEELKKENMEYYQIIYMICCKQMTLSDVSQVLNMTYCQTNMKLHRARNWIRKHYKNDYY